MEGRRWLKLFSNQEQKFTNFFIALLISVVLLLSPHTHTERETERDQCKTKAHVCVGAHTHTHDHFISPAMNRMPSLSACLSLSSFLSCLSETSISRSCMRLVSGTGCFLSRHAHREEPLPCSANARSLPSLALLSCDHLAAYLPTRLLI